MAAEVVKTDVSCVEDTNKDTKRKVITDEVEESEKKKMKATIETTTEKKPKPVLGFGAFANKNPFVQVSEEAKGLKDMDSEALNKPITEKKDVPIFQTKETTTRATKVSVKSGEEEEKVVLELRAKLYRLDEVVVDNKVEGKSKQEVTFEWKELGVGNIRLNEDKNDKRKLPRLIMRRQGVLKLLLNVLISRKFPIEKAGEKAIRFSVPSDNKAIVYLLKFARNDDSVNFLSTIKARILEKE